jgi:integrase
MGIFRKYKDKNNKPTGPWFIQYPDSRDPKTGKIRYKTIKGSYEKKRAEKLFRAKQDEFQEAEVLGRCVKRDMTFSELMDWGLSQEVMKVKASASDDIVRAKHMKAHFKEQKASRVTPLDADNFRITLKQSVSERTGRPFSGTTVNKVISLARRIYYLGMDAGIVSTNPFARRGVYKEEPRGKYIPDDEFWELYEYFPEFLKPVACVAYMTGMRRGEILELTWDRVDFDEGCIDLTSEDTKTSEPRKIYFNSIPKLKNVFVGARNRRKKGQPLVFTTPDGKSISNKWYLQRVLKRACKQTGLGPYRLHDLRHTFNTNMVKAGVEKVVVMKLTGHKTFAMFARYSHLDREQGEAAMKKLEGFLAGKKAQGGSSTPYVLPEQKRASG